MHTYGTVVPCQKRNHMPGKLLTNNIIIGAAELLKVGENYPSYLYTIPSFSAIGQG